MYICTRVPTRYIRSEDAIYIPTYLHTYIHTYLHTYLPTYLPTYIRTFLYTYTHPIFPTSCHPSTVSTQPTRPNHTTPHHTTSSLSLLPPSMFLLEACSLVLVTALKLTALGLAFKWLARY